MQLNMLYEIYCLDRDSLENTSLTLRFFKKCLHLCIDTFSMCMNRCHLTIFIGLSLHVF